MAELRSGGPSVPAERHPIEQALVDGLVDRNATLGYEDVGLQAIEAALRGRFGHPDLKAAVAEVIVFAFFLEVQKGAAEAANALIDLLTIARAPLEAQGLGIEAIVGSADVESRTKALLGASRDVVPVGSKARVEGSKSWWALRADVAKKNRE